MTDFIDKATVIANPQAAADALNGREAAREFMVGQQRRAAATPEKVCSDCEQMRYRIKATSAFCETEADRIANYGATMRRFLKELNAGKIEVEND